MRALVHRRIYLVLLTLLGGCMVTTVGLSNVVWPLLLANWLFEGRWREKWQMARESRLLLAIAVLFLMHVLGLLWTSDMKPGLHIVERMLPFMAVPLVVLTTPSPEGNTRRFILNFYGFTVFVVTIIGFVRWLTIPDLPHREIVTYISHIRFSLNICMVIFLLAFYGRRSAGSDSQRHFPFFIFHFSIFNLLLILWFLFFLFSVRLLIRLLYFIHCVRTGRNFLCLSASGRHYCQKGNSNCQRKNFFHIFQFFPPLHRCAVSCISESGAPGLKSGLEKLLRDAGSDLPHSFCYNIRNPAPFVTENPAKKGKIRLRFFKFFPY